MFGLEREKADLITRRAISVIVLALLIVVVVTYVNQFIAPTLPPDILKPPTPTPNVFATPLSSPTAINSLPDTSTPMIAPTVTLQNPTNNVQQSASEQQSDLDDPLPGPLLNQPDCPENTNISAPPNNVTVSGPITFFGNAYGDDFRDYDIQANGPQPTETWSSLIDVRSVEPVIDGILATVDLTNAPPGTYAIRLLVFDNSGREQGQCTIQLIVDPASS